MPFILVANVHPDRAKKKTALHPTQNRPARALDTKRLQNFAPANGF